MVDPVATPAAPASEAQADAAAGGEQGFCIEISCLPDGTFQVSSEPLEQEAAEETGAAGSETGQTAKSFGEALKLALQLYQSNGEDPNESFEAGYNGKAPEETATMGGDKSMMGRG